MPGIRVKAVRNRVLAITSSEPRLVKALAIISRLATTAGTTIQLLVLK